MKIFIHVGPPKTGTSAIQKWCTEHTSWLLEHGCYYPEHELDDNGVSSGNLESLYNRTSNGSLIFSNAKLSKLIEQAKLVDADTILLSSEFFFKRIDELAELLPDAIFIAYIRFELGLIESSYNQSVKRHRHTEILKLPQSPLNNSLHFLSKYIDLVGQKRVKLRAYGHSAFTGGSIVSDLMDGIGIQLDESMLTLPSSRVNSGYTLEGLEFKRWFNAYPSDGLDSLLDAFLQQEAESGVLNFSIISGSAFVKLKKILLKQLMSFCDRFEVINDEALLASAAAQQQYKVKIQNIGHVTFSTLVSHFIQFNMQVLPLLEQFLVEYSQNELCPEDKLRVSEISKAVNAARSANRKVLAPTWLKSLVNNARNRLIGENAKNHEVISKWEMAPNFKLPNQVNTNAQLLWHQIPFSESQVFLKALQNIYGKKSVFIGGGEADELVAKSEVKHSTLITAKVVCGNFSDTDKLSVYFPNAMEICWIQDPLERLWQYFKSVLHNERPLELYQQLMTLAQKKRLVNEKYLFVAMLESPVFTKSNNVYSTYFDEESMKRLCFVGALHRWNEDISKLDSLLSEPVSRRALIETKNRVTLPSDLRKFDSLLSREYEVLSPYL